MSDIEKERVLYGMVGEMELTSHGVNSVNWASTTEIPPEYFCMTLYIFVPSGENFT